jgi:hypothetical protein
MTLNITVSSAVFLNAIMLSVVMLSVVAPLISKVGVPYLQKKILKRPHHSDNKAHFLKL